MKSKAQLEPRPTLAASTNDLAQNTLVIPGQVTFKHIRQSPEYSLIILMGLYFIYLRL
jgi:hypothetical protein